MRARDSRMMGRSRILRPRVIFGVATLLGFFSAFQAYQFVRFFSERDTSYWVLLGLNLGYWYAWAVLVPIVLFMARRFPFDRERWPRSVPVHLVAVLVLTFAHVVMSEGVRYGLDQAGGSVWMKNMTWWAHVRYTYFISFDWGGVRLSVSVHDGVRGPSRDPLRIMVNLAVADIRAAYERLRRAGVVFTRPPEREDWGGQVATFADPDGNVLQLMQLLA